MNNTMFIIFICGVVVTGLSSWILHDIWKDEDESIIIIDSPGSSKIEPPKPEPPKETPRFTISGSIYDNNQQPNGH